MKSRLTIKSIAACALLVSANAVFSQNSSYQHHLPIPTSAAPGAKVALSPYASEQTRALKSLPEADVMALQSGIGMSYAKAAELNGYPGPVHVLELAASLNLTSNQRVSTEGLMASHKAKASALGARLVEAERTLDSAFASKRINAGRVTELTQAIGVIQANLRAEHLQTHLVQTTLLTSQQVALYQTLRGYDIPVKPTTTFSR